VVARELPRVAVGKAAHMLRIVLCCKCVSENAGVVAARGISEEFMRRLWHGNVTCVWDGCQLILQADNDFDSNGLALVDEFSDAISACIKDGFDGDIEILSMDEPKSFHEKAGECHFFFFQIVPWSQATSVATLFVER
jgi:hypothetical protein